MLICWSRKMLPWMSRLKILVFKWQYVSLWNLLLTVNPLLRNPFSWGNYGTKLFVSLIEEKAMTLLVINHNVAKCDSGKVKHKTSAGQRSPSLILYGLVLVFNRALVIFQHFRWGQSFCWNSFLCHCCSFSPSMSFATISFVITLLFQALFGLCKSYY